MDVNSNLLRSYRPEEYHEVWHNNLCMSMSFGAKYIKFIYFHLKYSGIILVENKVLHASTVYVIKKIIKNS